MSECMTQEDAERMDNEQAIAILKPLQDMMRDQYGCPISDAYFAVGKAIEALSQPQRKPGKTLAEEVERIKREITDIFAEQMSAQPQHEVRFSDADHVWIDGKQYISLRRFMGAVKEAQPQSTKLDEWCDDCAEYDKERHCCPRFNRVIRTTLDDVRKDAYKHGKSKGIKRGMAMARRKEAGGD